MRAAQAPRAVLAVLLAIACTSALAQQPPQNQRQRRPPPPPPRAEAPLPPASPEQLEAAALAHLGIYDCEFNEKVSVTPSPKFEGYIDVKHKAQAWIMKPVLSRTGALRLEDVKSRMLMLQIADKSMLMDTVVGRRLVDGCVHEKQRELVAARKASGFVSESIGIDPAKAAAAAAAAASAAAVAANAAALAASGAAAAASGAAAAASAAAAAASGAASR